MLECFPRNDLLAEPLHGALSAHEHTERERNQQLTPTIFCKSLFEYVLITFTATSRPQYTPFHTSANPPLYNAASVRSYQTVIFMAFGRSAWRPHVLYNDLRHFFRIRGGKSRFSSAWLVKHVDVDFNQQNRNGKRLWNVPHLSHRQRLVRRPYGGNGWCHVHLFSRRSS